MSHLLCMLFEFHRFRRDAVLRIHADDFLVDEINLQEDIPLKVVRDQKYRGNYKPDGEICPVWILPKKIFMFEIDSQHLRDRISIEVKNPNSNYTNGFVTDFSWIRFHALFLIPKCLQDVANWEKLERFKNITDDRYMGSKLRKVTDFPLTAPKLKGIKVKTSTTNWGGDFLCNTRGGDFAFDIPLYRKHKQIHFNKPPPGKIQLMQTPRRILSVFNLLNTNNEDQRSNHT